MASHSVFLDQPFTVNSDKTTVTEDSITSTYEYHNTTVQGSVVTPTTETYTFKTCKRVPKLGMMLVGWGGNNGSTVTAGVLANKMGTTWRTKEGVKEPNYFGRCAVWCNVWCGVRCRVQCGMTQGICVAVCSGGQGEVS